MPSRRAAVQSKGKRGRPKSLRWPEFAHNLMEVLGALEKEQYLIISTKQGNRYVQFVKRPRRTRNAPEIRVEVVSNAFLTESERIANKQIAMLSDLGFRAPTHGSGDLPVPNGSPNYHRDFQKPLDPALIARIASEALVTVLKVSRPADLEYRAFQEPGGLDVRLPRLGIDKAAISDSDDPGFEEIRAAVLDAVRQESSQPTAVYDEDGDIPVGYGEALLFVRLSDTPRFARVRTLLAREVVRSEALLARLNDLNARAKLVRLLHASEGIWAVADVFGDPLLPRHVIHACHVIGEVANDLRGQMQAQFGSKMKRLPQPLEN